MNKVVAVVMTVTILMLGQAANATNISEIPLALQEKITAAETACASFDNGKFLMADDALKQIDLDGDGDLDWVLNEVSFTCSSAASLYGGTGGSMSHFVVTGVVASVLNQGWVVTSFGPHSVLLVDVHGSQCGGINPTPCATSSIWDQQEKVWRSAKTPWE